jgi:hypothetical protein
VDLLGAPGAGLAIAAENLFPPLPSELILPLAGFDAARDHDARRRGPVHHRRIGARGALILYAGGAARAS